MIAPPSPILIDPPTSRTLALLGETNAWIDQRLHDIDHQVGDDDRDADDEDSGDDDRHVALKDAADDQPPDPRPGEDAFGDDRASHQPADLKAEKAQDR